MKNADMPAMPLSGEAYQDFAGYNPDKNDSSYNPECQGLTKREHFSAMAMQGLLARGYSDLRNNMAGEQRLSNEAIRIADALLEELAK